MVNETLNEVIREYIANAYSHNTSRDFNDLFST